MGEAALEEDVPFLEQPLRAAAVLCRTQYGNLHAGLLHRASDGAAAILHLGWQDHLSKEWNWARLWAAPDVEPERLVSVAGMCRLIWKCFEEEGRFPYAIKFSQTSFSSQGQLVLGEGAQGLTCSTFVLAVFNSVGVKLVDETGWPVRAEEDKHFLESVRRFTTAEHYAMLEREVADGCKRIHPQEVIGACACVLPAGFIESRDAGARALEVLDRQR